MMDGFVTLSSSHAPAGRAERSRRCARLGGTEAEYVGKSQTILTSALSHRFIAAETAALRGQAGLARNVSGEDFMMDGLVTLSSSHAPAGRAERPRSAPVSGARKPDIVGSRKRL